MYIEQALYYYNIQLGKKKGFKYNVHTYTTHTHKLMVQCFRLEKDKRDEDQDSDGDEDSSHPSLFLALLGVPLRRLSH